MSEQDQPPGISETLRENLLQMARTWEPEVRQLLPELPSDITITLNNYYVIPDTGTGGFAESKNKIILAFDPNFSGDKTEQLKNFRASLFHEAYHLAQGFVGDDSAYRGLTLIQNAIYEGAATKFEVIRAGSSPGWSQYPPDQTEDWLAEVLSVGIPASGHEWGRWKFFDPETGRRWVAYRVGCYVIDRALENSDKQIEELVHLTADEILTLSGLMTHHTLPY